MFRALALALGDVLDSTAIVIDVAEVADIVLGAIGLFDWAVACHNWMASIQSALMLVP